MSHNIFGSGPNPNVFNTGARQNNNECCDSPNDNIMNCADVMACVSLNFGANMDAPFIPYWTGTTFNNSSIYYDLVNNAVRLSNGSVIASFTNGEATLGNSAVNEWWMTTDGGVGLESWLWMSPTDIEIARVGGSTDYVLLDSTASKINHSSLIRLMAPLTESNDLSFTSGSYIASNQAGSLLRIDFGPSDDQFNMYTDGTSGSETFLNFWPTLITFGIQAPVASDILIGAAELKLAHATDINFNAPTATFTGDVRIFDTNTIDSSAAAATIGLFNLNASIINSGASGATWNMASTFAMQSAMIQLASGVAARPSINIPAGVAPTTPANGDIWSTATNDELVMHQNGVSVTLLSAKAVTTEVIVSDTSVTVVIGGTTYKLLARA